jgi:hypothetical protein
MSTIEELIFNLESAYNDKLEAKRKLNHAEFNELSAKITALQFLFPGSPRKASEILANSLSSEKVFKLLEAHNN